MLNGGARKILIPLLFMVQFCVCPLLQALPQVILPADSSLQANQLAVVVNERDALSSAIARYYQQRRNIPEENILYVSFDPDQSVMDPGTFAVLKKQLDLQTPRRVQAYALTWAAPYRVGCMSISAAFTFGYDKKFCTKGCKPTAISPYAGSRVFKPFSQLGIRPTMLIAADNYEDAKRLIDLGLASEQLSPYQRSSARALLVTTDDQRRNVRKIFFPAIVRQLGEKIDVKMVSTSPVKNESHVMFYFTGDEFIEGISSNNFLAGAVADHLTSTGGKLTDSGQMSAMKWLEGGATGSYGTVVEPCNMLEKFPNPQWMMSYYLGGSTLIEAYWKSVQMPGQGVFIGEPLAKPYPGYSLKSMGGSMLLSSDRLSPGQYRVLVAEQREGPYTELIPEVSISNYIRWIRLPLPLAHFYKIEHLPAFSKFNGHFSVP